MDINDFIYKNFFLKFWVVYIYAIILGIISSYFVSYEGKYALTLFTENKLPIINIIFLNISTVIFGIRSGLHNYIRHTMYIKTIDYFFKNICLQKLEYWDKYITDADLLKCMLTDITIFINVCSRTFSLILKSAITSFFISFTLLHTNTYYFLLAIFLCIIRSLILEKYSKKWEDYNYKVNNIKQELESHLSDFIKNNISFQLCGVERTYVHIIDTMINKYIKEGHQESLIYSSFMLLFNIITKIMDIGLYFISEKDTTILEIQIIVSYFKILSDSIQNIVDIYKDFYRHKVSILNVIKHINNSYDLNRKYFTKVIRINLQPNIEFKNITFKYNSRNDYIFKNLNQTINFKDKVAIIGESGKGKSTLFKLLKGQYTPNDGYVLVNDKDVSTMDTFELNKLIAVVPQEPVILPNNTLRENIELFTYKRHIPTKELITMFKKLELTNLIPHIDNKLINLSCGQKQRISILRALMSKAPIILLDEPFSGLNYSLKNQLYDLLIRVTLHKTVILITHDIDIVQDYNWNIWKI